VSRNLCRENTLLLLPPFIFFLFLKQISTEGEKFNDTNMTKEKPKTVHAELKLCDQQIPPVMDNLVSQGHCIEGQHATTIKLQLVQKHKKYIGNMAYIILKYLEINLCSYFKYQ